jgi:hypothetical protein
VYNLFLFIIAIYGIDGDMGWDGSNGRPGNKKSVIYACYGVSSTSRLENLMKILQPHLLSFPVSAIHRLNQ